MSGCFLDRCICIGVDGMVLLNVCDVDLFVKVIEMIFVIFVGMCVVVGVSVVDE